MQNFFWEIVRATTTQLGLILGFFLVIGFVLSQVQKFTQRQYYQSVGWFGILWTAWIGTPVHELSHWLMAKIFFHQIDSVSLFRPNRQSGKLGEVQHSYNPKNWFQQIGNFFIGAAPLLGGAIVLFLLLTFLLPNSRELLASAEQFDWHQPLTIFNQFPALGKIFVSSAQTEPTRFWLFIYLSFSVASHLAPSSVDQKSMWRGLGWLVICLLMINTFSYLVFKNFFQPVFSWNFFTWVFIYALIVSSVHACISFILFLPFRRR